MAVPSRSRAIATVSSVAGGRADTASLRYTVPMIAGPQLAEVAALAGDPARANILLALLDGRARTSTELSFFAGVSPQTTSGHLAKLAETRLLLLHRQGRHRYYRLASPLVGRMLEALAAVASDAPPRYRRPSKMDDALRTARTCYDHIAGQLGVAITDVLVERGHVVLADEGGAVTPSGQDFFASLGLDLAAGGRRVFCRPCLDWSERRPHLAGALGAALCGHCLAAGWTERTRDSRALAITRKGEAAFAELFGIEPERLRCEPAAPPPAGPPWADAVPTNP